MPDDSSSRVETTARAILAARRNRSALPPPADATVPQSREEAFAVQAIVTRELGQPIAGWKTAVTPDNETLFAPIYAADTYSSGSKIGLPAEPARLVEIEIGFILGRDISPADGPFDEARFRAAVSHFIFGIEMIQSRYASMEKPPHYLPMADNMSNGAYIIGPRLALPAKVTVPTQIKAQANGKQFWNGPGIQPNGNPFIAPLALVNGIGTHLGGLRRGQFITAGNLTNPPFPVPGKTAVSVSSELGQIETEIA